jgi:hypothetical protein
MSNTRRFAIGVPDGLNSSRWRFWTNKNDIYVAVRSLAGDIKTSLHESDECQTSFTDTSTFLMNNKEYFKKRLERGRHIKTWEAKEIRKGLWLLLNIAIPNDSLKKVQVKEKPSKKIEWIEPLLEFKISQFTFFKCDGNLGDDSWVGNNCIVFHKGQLEDGKYFYVLFYGTNADIKKVIIENTGEVRKDNNSAYRSVRAGVSPVNGIGYLIDG